MSVCLQVVSKFWLKICSAHDWCCQFYFVTALALHQAICCINECQRELFDSVFSALCCWRWSWILPEGTWCCCRQWNNASNSHGNSLWNVVPSQPLRRRWWQRNAISIVNCFTSKIIRGRGSNWIGILTLNPLKDNAYSKNITGWDFLHSQSCCANLANS